MMNMSLVPHPLARITGTALLAASSTASNIAFDRSCSVVRACVGVWVHSRVRLDTDAETDPFHHLTAQVKAHNRIRRSTPTDPLLRGLSRGGIDA